jgi:hypothetical protein
MVHKRRDNLAVQGRNRRFQRTEVSLEEQVVGTHYIAAVAAVSPKDTGQMGSCVIASACPISAPHS